VGRKRITMNIQFTIENLKCGGCAATIKKGILSLEKVTDISISVATSEVTVTATEDVRKAVKEKLAAMGYPEVGAANTLRHKATSYVSCAVGKMSAKE